MSMHEDGECLVRDRQAPRTRTEQGGSEEQERDRRGGRHGV